MLKEAAADAAEATQLDVSWLEGALREAEAIVALGPDQRAMEACRILSKAVKTLDNLAPDERKAQQSVCSSLQERLKFSKARAKAWCVFKPGTTPAQAVEQAVGKLSQTVAFGLALPHQDEATDAGVVLGRQIAEDVATIAAILRAGYCDETWDFANIDEEIPDKVQRDLRKLAKLVPLRAVAASPELKALVFYHDPWSLWGMDRLDRAAGLYMYREEGEKRTCACDRDLERERKETERDSLSLGPSEIFCLERQTHTHKLETESGRERDSMSWNTFIRQSLHYLRHKEKHCDTLVMNRPLVKKLDLSNEAEVSRRPLRTKIVKKPGKKLDYQKSVKHLAKPRQKIGQIDSKLQT